MIGQTIRETKLHWSHHPSEVADDPYPLAISLGFEDGSVVVITAACLQEEAGEITLIPGGDEIAVIWDSAALAELLPEVVNPRAAS